MQLFYQPNIPMGVTYLDAEESRHCVKVLRQKAGDTIHITDGQGTFYTARIIAANSRQCNFEVIEKSITPKKNYHIHIGIAPTKNLDRTEWFVEKAVELGIDEISFLICDNSERVNLKPDRLERKAISALKQSLKASLPTLNGLTRFNKFITHLREDQKYIAYVDRESPSPHLKTLIQSQKSYCILIGPEGDFSPNEITLAIKEGFMPVSLGQSRLRTETAGITACVIFNLFNEE